MSAIEQNQEIVVDTTLERPASPSLDLSGEGQEFQGLGNNPQKSEGTINEQVSALTIIM